MKGPARRRPHPAVAPSRHSGPRGSQQRPHAPAEHGTWVPRLLGRPQLRAVRPQVPTSPRAPTTAPSVPAAPPAREAPDVSVRPGAEASRPRPAAQHQPQCLRLPAAHTPQPPARYPPQSPNPRKPTRTARPRPSEARDPEPRDPPPPRLPPAQRRGPLASVRSRQARGIWTRVGCASADTRTLASRVTAWNKDKRRNPKASWPYECACARGRRPRTTFPRRLRGSSTPRRPRNIGRLETRRLPPALQRVS